MKKIISMQRYIKSFRIPNLLATFFVGRGEFESPKSPK